MASPAATSRQELLARLAGERFDLLVIGGGITGAGIARDAALRGLSVALVDKGDFAVGTSSKSSKLVHGGLRYLEHAQFRLVFEGTNERALLMRTAPHLVRPLEFLLPVYRHDKPGLFVLDVGLWIYDGLSKFSSPKLHRTVRGAQAARLEPCLRSEALEGALLYYDCATDDARLTLENLLDARQLGAACANYVEVVKLLREGERVVGAEVEAADAGESGGGRFAIAATVTVNATGPWTDALRQLAGEPPVLHTSKGVHLVVDAVRLPLRRAVVMKEKRRVVFCIPWGERTIIGTTDTFYEGRPEAAACDGADADYLLGIANRYFPEARLGRGEVLATWAGLRPLLRPDSAVSASDVSREHQLFEAPGLLTIAGGKLTTYRRMAAEVVDRLGAQLVAGGGDRALPPSATGERPLPGAAGALFDVGHAGLPALENELKDDGLDEEVARLLAATYGVRARSLVERIAAEPRLGERLDPELGYILAQVDVAVDEEQAHTLDDLLGRRVPLLLRGRDQGLVASERVAARMAERLGWSTERKEKELARYRDKVAESRRFQTT